MLRGADRRVGAAFEPACSQGSISVGQTISNAWDSQDCVAANGEVVDFWTFTAVTGQQLTVTVTFADGSLAPVQIGLERSSDGTVLAENQGNSPVSLTYTIPATAQYYLSVASIHPSALGSYTLSLTGPATCVQDGRTLCLLAGRYAVTADWVKPTGESGHGTAIPLTTDTGYFWFFASSNVEAIVKVLDGCALGGHRWVFASGLTNVEVTIQVIDTENPAVMKTYVNPQGTAFQPVQDTSAFPCS